ncbi:Demethylmenaquinone methyltransferase-like protein [Paraburkholderia graminis C4D1M]|uniref:Demethylmenaquinone methyltransferase-like protein n=1 Tax=Paraburkholderia graminis (strain ATCC 700544 / DSM 17151 / LMG 18924 / NCIMB 13744 / C4D1M) TaxID=396598 RepID=B1G0E8_PARG4|nr:Demethylmenaquinone methyltransferase-like protein [Paraburkholderia graminis C4D1M]
MTASEIVVSEATLEQLRHVSTATLTTQLFKRGLRNVFLQGVAPLVKPAPGAPNVVGPAFTLRNIPAREDLDHVGVFQDPDHPQRKAVETAPAGSVLVQDCRGERSVASVGSILALRLAKRGVAGMVSDGPVRDSGTIAALGLPIWCAGARRAAQSRETSCGRYERADRVRRRGGVSGRHRRRGRGRRGDRAA